MRPTAAPPFAEAPPANAAVSLPSAPLVKAATLVLVTVAGVPGAPVAMAATPAASRLRALLSAPGATVFAVSALPEPLRPLVEMWTRAVRVPRRRAVSALGALFVLGLPASVGLAVGLVIGFGAYAIVKVTSSAIGDLLFDSVYGLSTRELHDTTADRALLAEEQRESLLQAPLTGIAAGR